MSGPRPGSLASRLEAGPGAVVLVVEDEPDIAAFLGAFFRASGTEVVHVDPRTAAEVVEAVAEWRPACLLVDLNLTGTSGFEVLAALNDDERTAGTPALIVTADGRAATQERAAALGAAGFVPKPFNVKDLLRTVEGLVGRDAGVALLSAEAVMRELEDAVADGRRARTSTTLALVRVTGTAPSPALLAEVAASLAPAHGRVLGATGAAEIAVVFAGLSASDAAANLATVAPEGRLALGTDGDRLASLELRVGLAGCPEQAAAVDELYVAADIAVAEAVEAGLPLVVAR